MITRFIVCLTVVLAGVLSLPGHSSAADRPLPAVDQELYAADPVPLVPIQCGQCHTSQFSDLKNAGGKHRFACQECHQVFHAYNPRKDNYDQIMPDCGACHEQPHGPKAVDCLNCHRNPHAPLKVPAMDRLANACAGCHQSPAAQLQQYPSAHTEQGCQGCHYERHGYIPNCYECHEGHFEGQAADSCLTCHQQVHAPLIVSLSPDAEVKTCSGCHSTVFDKWQTTPSKHGNVSCGMCHQAHGKIPACTDCHAAPHDKQQLAMFPNCLTCHIDVHDLPVKKK